MNIAVYASRNAITTDSPIFTDKKVIVVLTEASIKLNRGRVKGENSTTYVSGDRRMGKALEKSAVMALKQQKRGWQPRYRLFYPFYHLPLPPLQLALPLGGEDRITEWLSASLIQGAKPPILAQRLEVIPAPIAWAQQVVKQRHYLHKPVFPRVDPIGYAILLDGQPVGVIICATPNFAKQRGLFGYPELPTQWQVLTLSRLWLHPDVQGRKVADRYGKEHALPVASCAIGKLLKRIHADWLEHHPPPFPDQPHNVRLIVAYADPSAGHSGCIYKAAGFQFHGWTKPSKAGVKGTRGAKDGHRKKRFVKYLPPSTPTVDSC